MSTCNHLDIESLGCWLTMPKNFLGTARKHYSCWHLTLFTWSTGTWHHSLTSMWHTLITSKYFIWKLRSGVEWTGLPLCCPWYKQTEWWALSSWSMAMPQVCSSCVISCRRKVQHNLTGASPWTLLPFTHMTTVGRVM